MRKNKNLKLKMRQTCVLGVLLAGAMLLTTGCQLAKEGAGNLEKDKLIGVCVTTEPVSNVDLDAYLEENMDEILENTSDGDEVVLEIEEENANKIYGELSKTTETIVFPGVDGIMFGYLTATDEEGGEKYSYMVFDEGVHELGQLFHTTDTGVNKTMVHAQMYLSSRSAEKILYFNPVYETADGKFYMVPGEGMHFIPSNGVSGNMEYSDEYSQINSEGIKVTEEFAVKVNIAMIDIAQRAILIQMDENNQEISRMEVVPGQMPEELIPEEGVAYILIEKYVGSDKTISVNQPNTDETSESIIELFYDSGNGICYSDELNVKWP